MDDDYNFDWRLLHYDVRDSLAHGVDFANKARQHIAETSELLQAVETYYADWLHAKDGSSRHFTLMRKQAKFLKVYLELVDCKLSITEDDLENVCYLSDHDIDEACVPRHDGIGSQHSAIRCLVEKQVIFNGRLESFLRQHLENVLNIGSSYSSLLEMRNKRDSTLPEKLMEMVASLKNNLTRVQEVKMTLWRNDVYDGERSRAILT